MIHSPVQEQSRRRTGDPNAAETLAALENAVANISDLPVTTMGAQQAQQELFELWETTERLRIEALRRLTAITQAGLSGVLYVSDTRYVAHQQGITNQEAKNQLKLSSFLASNTLSAKAVLNNDIGLGHADALARAWSAHPEDFADVEQQFLDAIPGRDVDSFHRLVKQWEWRIENNGADEAEESWGKRHFSAQRTLDGSAVGSFRFAADDAEILLGAISTMPDPIGTLTPPRSLGQRQADALIEALSDTDSDVETSGGSGVKIDVTIDIQTLAGIVDGTGKEWTVTDLRSELGRTGDLPPAIVEKLMCDAVSRSARTHLSALGRRNVSA